MSTERHLAAGQADSVLRAAARRGTELAERVLLAYQTTNPLVIALRADIKVIYERWPLISVGEFEARDRTIRVNLAALEINSDDRWFAPQALRRMIVAHELGHFFNRQEPPFAAHCDRAFDEAVAHQFAVRLVGTPYDYREYERRWRSLQRL